MSEGVPGSALNVADKRLPFAGKYAVERVIGRGGMGTVFEARHLRLGHHVAIKVLGHNLRGHPELVTRFEREARATGASSDGRTVEPARRTRVRHRCHERWHSVHRHGAIERR